MEGDTTPSDTQNTTETTMTWKLYISYENGSNNRWVDTHQLDYNNAVSYVERLYGDVNVMGQEYEVEDE